MGSSLLRTQVTSINQDVRRGRCCSCLRQWLRHVQGRLRRRRRPQGRLPLHRWTSPPPGSHGLMTKVSSTQENDTEKIDTTSPIPSSTSFSTQNPAMSMTESYTALLKQYEKLKETAENYRLEIATMQIEKGLAESSLD